MVGADERTGDQGRLPLERLRQRADFLHVAKGRRSFAPAFVVQGSRRGGPANPATAPSARFGLTITKKTGTAVERNRMRRRLREAIKMALGMDARPGCDYVIVAQREALTRPFSAMVADLERAVADINAKLDKKLAKQRPQMRS